MARKNDTHNTASGTDSVRVQVGRVVDSKTSKDKGKDRADTPTIGTNTNSTSGNARVGIQADVITGPIVIRR